jgi:lactate dehydrogenase-like 2-hydroxyacid dehydrogenase
MSQQKKNVLIVGVGSIGQRHLRCFKETGRATLSLCEVNPALRWPIATTPP